MLFLYCQTQTIYFVIIFSAEDLFTLNSDKFRIVYKVDGNPHLIHVVGACTPTSLTSRAVAVLNQVKII